LLRREKVKKGPSTIALMKGGGGTIDFFLNRKKGRRSEVEWQKEKRKNRLCKEKDVKKEGRRACSERRRECLEEVYRCAGETGKEEERGTPWQDREGY